MVVLIESHVKNCDVIILDSRVPILSCLIYLFRFVLFCLLNVCLFLFRNLRNIWKNGTFHRIMTVSIPVFFVVLRGNRHKFLAGGYFKGKLGFLCSPWAGLSFTWAEVQNLYFSFWCIFPQTQPFEKTNKKMSCKAVIEAHKGCMNDTDTSQYSQTHVHGFILLYWLSTVLVVWRYTDYDETRNWIEEREDDGSTQLTNDWSDTGSDDNSSTTLNDR